MCVAPSPEGKIEFSGKSTSTMFFWTLTLRFSGERGLGNPEFGQEIGET